MFLSSDQLSFLSAATRHRSDAERLLSSSPDQSFHLAGLAPECAQKAVLTGRWLDKAVGHLGDPVGVCAIEFAFSAEPAAARYRLPPVGGGLGGWRVDCRYERTGTRALSEARSAVLEAGIHVDKISAALFLDGRIPAGFTW